MYRDIKIHLAVSKESYDEQFYDAKSNYCLFCLKEKYFIINYPQEMILLNKLSELISKYGHKHKNTLVNIGKSGKRNNDFKY